MNSVSSSLKQVCSQFRVPIGRSTMLLGVADPLGCLQPDEIHLAFSSQFTEDGTGLSLPYLHDEPALVARHPSLRNSDIQKV